LPEIFAIEFFELCPHRRKPPLEAIAASHLPLGGSFEVGPLRQQASIYSSVGSPTNRFKQSACRSL
jgi:hypothetical protein